MHNFIVKCGAILLSAAMLLSCAACGSTQTDSAAETAAADETSAPAAPTGAESPVKGTVIISEVMCDNKATLTDADGEFSDWVELYNAGSSAADLSGWTLSDAADSFGWAFPSVTLAPGEYLLVYADKKDLSDGELHTDFGLSDEDVLTLYDADGLTVDTCSGLSSRADVSDIRSEDGSFAECLYPTPGYSNDADGWEAFQNSRTAEGPLVISEVAVANFNQLYQANMDGYCDWVEIRNISSGPVSLADYSLSDTAKDLYKCNLPDKTLEAGETLILLCDKDESDITSSEYSRLYLGLDDDNDRLYLTENLSGRLLDYVSLKDIPYCGTIGRMDGQNGFWYFSTPTPGTANTNGQRRVAASPVSAEADGVFNDVASVTVTLQADGQIYYTTDGSLPTSSSTPYTGPFTVSETCAVRAISVENGALPSRALTLNYIINENLTLPVVCVTSDSVWEFDSMYNGGVRGLELPGTISFYDENGSFTAGCGLKMNGHTSLEYTKKNLGIRFRGAYGDGSVDYDIFGGGVTHFTDLVLRAGQDYFSTIIRDELGAELARSFSDNVVTQRSRYSILFINGEYWGIYCVKERCGTSLYAGLTDTDKDDVEVLEASISQTSDLFTDVFQYCYTHDMSLDENYSHFCDLMDVDSLIDWVIIEGYTGNQDLSEGNLRYCRAPDADGGKWKLMLYDLDSTFTDYGSIFNNTMAAYAISDRQIGSLLGTLMVNETFRDQLLTRAGSVLQNQLSDENVLAMIDKLAGEIDAEVARDYGRFGMTYDGWRGSIDYLKSVITGGGWRDRSLINLTTLFGLSEEEQIKYFGETVDLS